MQFLAAALTAPLFRKDELEREREVVIGEYDRNESSPFFQFSTAMGKALWSTAWSRKNPLGERDVIQSTTPEKMRSIQQRYYVPNNTAIIITGDVAPAKAFALARSDLRRLEARRRSVRRPNPIPPIPPLTRDTAVIVEQPIGSVVVMLQWQGPSATQGSRVDLCGRRVLRRAQPAGLALPAAARRQRAVSVDRRELLHAQSGWADHDRGRDVAGETEGRARRAARRDPEVRRAGLLLRRGAERDEAASHRRHDARVSSARRASRTNSVSGGPSRASTTSSATWTRWRSRRRRIFSRTPRSTSSASRTSPACCSRPRRGAHSSSRPLSLLDRGSPPMIAPTCCHPSLLRRVRCPRLRARADRTRRRAAFDVNGLRVILRRNTANDVVAANVYLLGGTQQLTPATQGIEALLLASSERGTKRFPREAVRQLTAALGSVFAIDPSEDWTRFGFTTHSRRRSIPRGRSSPID